MSDSALIFIPSDHLLVPDESAHDAAVKLLEDALLPSPRELMWQSVELRVHETPVPVVAMGNFEEVRCPFCNGDLLDWWSDQTHIVAKSSYVNLAAMVPCCNTITTLNHLSYQWPQGFARFELEVQNPRFNKFEPELLHQLEGILGCGMRVIYQHI